MKHRSKANALYRAGIKVRVCDHANQLWHDFTLQKNHMFGQDEDGYFVVRNIVKPGGKINDTVLPKGAIFVYRYITEYDTHGSPLARKWIVQSIGRNTDTGRQILAAAAQRDGKVEYISDSRQIRSFYNPPMHRSYAYTPMKHPTIPGGSWGNNVVSVQMPVEQVNRAREAALRDGIARKKEKREKKAKREAEAE